MGEANSSDSVTCKDMSYGMLCAPSAAFARHPSTELRLEALRSETSRGEREGYENRVYPSVRRDRIGCRARADAGSARARTIQAQTDQRPGHWREVSHRGQRVVVECQPGS